MKWLSCLAALAVVLVGCKSPFKPYKPGSMTPIVSKTHEGGFPRDPLNPPNGNFASPSEREHQAEACEITVSISGGGSNSAAFAFGAFEALNDASPAGAPGRSVLQEIDIFSTASGGGIGALMLIEIIREHRLREGQPLTQQNASLYLQSARFRCSLDSIYATVPAVLLKSGVSSDVERSLRIAMVGDPKLGKCDSRPLRDLERDATSSVEAFTKYVTCPLTDALKFDDVFVTADQTGQRKPQLPAFFANVTLFESGHNIPATSAWLEAFDISHVHFGRTGWLASLSVPSKDIDFVHAVTMSMSFPGIGPIWATTREDPPHGISIADGGQSDNLGLWTAYAATRNELNGPRAKRAVHIVLDSSLEPESYWIESLNAFTPWEEMLENGVPLLRSARLNAKSWLGYRIAADGMHDKYHHHMVSALDVLNSTDAYDGFYERDGSDVSKCYFKGTKLPTDWQACTKGLKRFDPPVPARQAITSFQASLANDRITAENLAVLGRVTMQRALDGGLKKDLEWCFRGDPAQP